MKIVAKYSFISFISILFNVIAQFIFTKLFYYNYNFLIEMFLGSISGVTVKIILDRTYIFYYMNEKSIGNILRFVVYSFFEIISILLFIILEVIFNFFIPIPFSRYLGVIIGLSIGYSIKYHFDKRYILNDFYFKYSKLE